MLLLAPVRSVIIRMHQSCIAFRRLHSTVSKSRHFAILDRSGLMTLSFQMRVRVECSVVLSLQLDSERQLNRRLHQ